MSIGRPKKSREEKLGSIVQVRFKDSEEAVLKDLAKIYNLTISKYIRSLALKMVYVKSDEENPDAEYMRGRYRPRKARSDSALDTG